MVEVGKPLPSPVSEREVIDLGGETRALGSLVDGPTLIVVLRHFGCAACDQLLTHLKPQLDLLLELGMTVVLVGNGERRYAEAFAERHHLPERGVALVTDPTLALHRAMSLEHSFWSAVGWPGGIRWLQAVGRGFRQNGLQGDQRQQGGALLLDDAGVVRFFHRSRATGHEPDRGAIGRHALAIAAAAARARGHREIV